MCKETPRKLNGWSNMLFNGISRYFEANFELFLQGYFFVCFLRFSNCGNRNTEQALAKEYSGQDKVNTADSAFIFLMRPLMINMAFMPLYM